MCPSLAKTAVLLSGLLALTSGCPAQLALAGWSHDDIRALHQSRQILSLDEIIAHHRRRRPEDKLLEAELEREQGRYVYELKTLGVDGQVLEFEYDARTGEPWRIEPEGESE